tara:strand:- start:1 stop:600 length:600 start_codon:yes stop_codon:yes gene_type:complete
MDILNQINIMVILKTCINLLNNKTRYENIIYYGNNIVKQNKDRLDIWIVIDDENKIENGYYYNSLNNSSTSSLEILKDNDNYILLEKISNPINEPIKNIKQFTYEQLIDYLHNFSTNYTISIINMKFSNNIYNNIILYDIFNASICKNFDDVKLNINKKYVKYKKKYINSLSKGTTYNINSVNNFNNFEELDDANNKTY